MPRQVGLASEEPVERVGGVKPYLKIAEARMPDGTLFTLHQHDGELYLKNDALDLMSTALTYSEQLLAEMGCAALVEGRGSRPACPRVLIGGLGMGFTLKRALEMVGRPAAVTVAELVPEIVEWNRTFLVNYNGPSLEDERTMIYQGDLFDFLMRENRERYDAILIDIDDAPDMLITKANARLYTSGFLSKIREALTPRGCVAYWLAEPTPSFERSLGKAGFLVEGFPAKPHEKSKRARHCIYVAHRR